ncbi:Ankyrin repeat and SOCS box protein 5 [Colletotrichum fructicola]|uniref:Ankyrin unc44 n=1 Tax=Colletotrichum fructicola (strain Nara gc5) TaxID=1213859 RepID=L2FIV5_COLFN|nr:Ankyrin repeat and SOCS box protein 5 [Colletotrichum fructicola]
MVEASLLVPELWLEIARHFRSRSKTRTAALARVNRYLHSIFQAELYRAAVKHWASEITIFAAAKGNLETLQVAAKYGARLQDFYLADPTEEVEHRWASALREHLPPQACWATPLHLAAHKGHYHVVKWLVAQGVDINAAGRLICDCRPVGSRVPVPRPVADHRHPMSDHPAWTPLHHAICGGHTSVAKLLLIAGANRNLMVPVGSASYPKEFTELQDSEATEHGDQHKPFAWFHDPARKAFVQDIHPIHVAAAFGNRSLVKYLTREWGVDIDRLDDNLATPLHHAIAAKNKSMVVYLLSHGADATKPWQLRVDNDAVVSHYNALDFALAFDADCCSAIMKEVKDIMWIETVDDDGHVRYESSLKPSLAAFAFEPRHEESVYTLRSYARTGNANLINYMRYSITSTTKTLFVILDEFVYLTEKAASLVGAGWERHFLAEMQASFIIICVTNGVKLNHGIHLRKFFDIKKFEIDSPLPRENVLQLVQLVASIPDAPSQWLHPGDKGVEFLSQCPVGTLALVFLISSTSSEDVQDDFRLIDLLIEKGAKLAIDDHSTIACSPLVVLLTRLKYDEDYYRMLSHRSWTGRNLVSLIKRLGYAGGWNTVMEANAQDMVVAVNDFFHAIPEDDRVTLFRDVRKSMPTSLQASVSKALGVELENDI